jgi:hypothetical protein
MLVRCAPQWVCVSTESVLSLSKGVSGKFATTSAFITRKLLCPLGVHGGKKCDGKVRLNGRCLAENGLIAYNPRALYGAGLACPIFSAKEDLLWRPVYSLSISLLRA